MTMHEEWTDKLSDYLDGELSEAERADLFDVLKRVRLGAGDVAGADLDAR